MMRQCAADDPAVVQPRNRTAASPVAL
jgi:hypothetical protein